MSDRDALLRVAQLRQRSEAALDRGDVEAAIRFHAAAEVELFAATWERGMVELPQPAEELTELQWLQRGLAGLLHCSRQAGEEVALAFREYLLLVAAHEGAKGPRWPR